MDSEMDENSESTVVENSPENAGGETESSQMEEEKDASEAAAVDSKVQDSETVEKEGDKVSDNAEDEAESKSEDNDDKEESDPDATEEAEGTAESSSVKGDKGSSEEE